MYCASCTRVKLVNINGYVTLGMAIVTNASQASVTDKRAADIADAHSFACAIRFLNSEACDTRGAIEKPSPMLSS